MPLHETRRIFPCGPKDSLFFLRKSFGLWEKKKKKNERFCGWIYQEPVLGYFSENRGYTCAFKDYWLHNLGFFVIWHNFYEGSLSIDRNVGIFPCV